MRPIKSGTVSHKPGLIRTGIRASTCKCGKWSKLAQLFLYATGKSDVACCRRSEIIRLQLQGRRIVASMKQDRPTASLSLKRDRRSASGRIVVFFLILAVPVLSTLAKDSAYLPQSNTGHFINIAAKMKVVDAPVVVSEPQVVPPLIALVLPEPEVAPTRPDQLEAPPVPKVSLKVCLQHRSPPIVLA